MSFDAIDTPALLLDLDAAERNIKKMADYYKLRRVKLRPHAKTHKTVELAKMQLDCGAIGICCAKLAEAEVLADGGISEILITTELIGEIKLERLMRLATKTHLIVVVDALGPARAMSTKAVEHGIKIDVLVDVDVGQNRTGVQPSDALVLGIAIAELPGLRLCGLQGYEGHLQHVGDAEARRLANADAMERLSFVAAAFAGEGLSTEIITTGGTGTAALAAEYAAITDVQPGSYVVMDTQYEAVDGLEFESALSVLTTVISIGGQWAVVDAGHKSLSSDAGIPQAIGVAATYALAGDEHGKLLFADASPVAIGDRVQIRPSHCDTTINLHDLYVLHRSGTHVGFLSIVNRGHST